MDAVLQKTIINGLKNLVLSTPEKRIEVTTKGNMPVLQPETITLTGEGIIRHSFDPILLDKFAWEEAGEEDIEIIFEAMSNKCELE